LLPEAERRRARTARPVSEAAVRKYIEDMTEPSHVRSELILDLWCRTTGKQREDVPRSPCERI
ncbi:hypothetical protein SB768_31490, partial [Burkholderia sp. SIMBA_043]